MFSVSKKINEFQKPHFMKKFVALMMSLTIVSVFLFGQNEKKISIDPSCELVSSYLWRGLPSYSVLGGTDVILGPNFQPGITLTTPGGFRAGAWGSTDFTGEYKETDLFLGFETENLTVELWDYYWVPDWSSSEYFNYNNDETGHIIEGILMYSFSEIPLKLTLGTMLYGADKKYDDPDKNAYSTYLEAAYSWDVSGNEITVAAGVTPRDGLYGDSYGGEDGFALVNLSATANRTIKISDSFELPVWGSLIANPQYNKIFLVFGISL